MRHVPASCGQSRSCQSHHPSCVQRNPLYAFWDALAPLCIAPKRSSNAFRVEIRAHGSVKRMHPFDDVIA